MHMPWAGATVYPNYTLDREGGTHMGTDVLRNNRGGQGLTSSASASFALLSRNRLWLICTPVMIKCGMSGISTLLDAADERVLQGFHLVQQAFEGPQYEASFGLLCHQAELRHSDAGLLAGRVQTLFAEREAVRYEAEANATIHQWLCSKEEQQGPE